MHRFRSLMILALALAPAVARAERAITFEEQTLVGKIQKPEIQILITKQNLTPKYELELKESFLPKIVQSVDLKPF
ncbi:MAG: hypothetical protein Q8P18_10160 [Pseudomonadota bacterium]|nr:hypothetical protein [Pseudomonadota bacterium]